WPPTAPKARAGLLTPPGISRAARANASWLRTRMGFIVDCPAVGPPGRGLSLLVFKEVRPAPAMSRSGPFSSGARSADLPLPGRAARAEMVRKIGGREMADVPVPLFKEHPADELHARLAPLGVTPRLARRLQSAVVRHGAREVPAELPEVSPRVLQQ